MRNGAKRASHVKENNKRQENVEKVSCYGACSYVKPFILRHGSCRRFRPHHDVVKADDLAGFETQKGKLVWLMRVVVMLLVATTLWWSVFIWIVGERSSESLLEQLAAVGGTLAILAFALLFAGQLLAIETDRPEYWTRSDCKTSRHSRLCACSNSNSARAQNRERRHSSRRQGNRGDRPHPWHCGW